MTNGNTAPSSPAHKRQKLSLGKGSRGQQKISISFKKEGSPKEGDTVPK